ncbi:YHS domain-containing (seleno)protein [Marinagarivorans algicola]|uniref:YHS domain-containing (seleno)protein n=1 Tax=Marinagarivorans algicola TaxID=1513270 RepID=UPI0006B4E7BC|nr:YHS domain-containing (seleno)protein [Marinagarivorans algicola]
MLKFGGSILVLVSILLSSYAFAANPLYNSYRDKGAIRGHDVVAYFTLPPGARAIKGKKEYATVWNNVAWYFSSQQNLERFKADPEAYAPQYGGYCSFAMSKNFTTSIRPDNWLIHEGKLYLNHNSISFRLFKKDLAESIEMANKNWPTVLTKCEKRNNCRSHPEIPAHINDHTNTTVTP